jgi:hypothetical protein
LAGKIVLFEKQHTGRFLDYILKKRGVYTPLLKDSCIRHSFLISGCVKIIVFTHVGAIQSLRSYKGKEKIEMLLDPNQYSKNPQLT